MAKPRTPKKVSNDQNVTAAETAAAVSTEKVNIPEPVKTVPESVSSELKNPARKPTIVRSEPRANLVPINLEEEIRRLAYLLSERRGFAPGHENEDWLTAEHEILQRYHQHSA
jgi:hypothetical protein